MLALEKQAICQGITFDFPVYGGARDISILSLESKENMTVCRGLREDF